MKLVVTRGENAGQEFPIDKAVVRIGRGPDNDVVLSDNQLSRQHVEIRQQGDQFIVTDLGSTNGTFINDRRIHQPHTWSPGDRLRIGNSGLSIQSGAAVPAAGPADYLDEYSFLDGEAPPAAAGGGGLAMWLVAGGVALLAVLIAGALLWLLLSGRGEEGTETPTATTVATTGIVLPSPSPATPTTEASPVSTEPPTVTPIIQVTPVSTAPPTVVGPLPSPPVETPPVPMPSGETPPVPMPTGEMPPGMPTGFPPDVPPEQIPTVMATMFPGMSPDEIATVVAPWLPYMPPEVATMMPGGIPSTGPATGNILYSAYDTTLARYDVYMIPSMGGTPVKLIDEATDPHVSPDGQRVAYRSWKRDAFGIHVMNLDGSGDTLLTHFVEDRYPRWSPDGQSILFSSDREGDRIGRAYVMKPDGTEVRTITEGQHASWAPSGDRIVYQGCVGGSCGLRMINLDGSSPAQITTDASDSAPVWSPDGSNIAFQSQQDGNWEVYVINTDGTWPRRVTQSPTIDSLPEWSPAGTHLAFWSDRDGVWAVWTTGAMGPPAFQLVQALPGDDWGMAGLCWANGGAGGGGGVSPGGGVTTTTDEGGGYVFTTTVSD